MTFGQFTKIGIVLAFSLVATGCMKWEYPGSDDDHPVSLPGEGLFIVNEGNFQYGNATLSYYDPADDSVVNEVFYKANAMKLGDVAQSMTIHNGVGWIVVNNSHVIFAINVETGREIGRIGNLTSPRYIHFLSGDKAYVSQLWDNRIIIVNPSTRAVTGYITVPGMNSSSGSTEQMVSVGDYVYCSCWSYNNRILKIDPATDTVVDQLVVGIQPNSLVADRHGNLWTITDGGYDGSPYGYEAPALYCIHTETFSVKRVYDFKLGEDPSELQINSRGDRIYWINGDIWSMDVADESLPVTPLIESKGTRYYGLTVSPHDGDVYVADAVDYQQRGKIYRYSSTGRLISDFYVGITPGSFCWK